jgi:uncharacterized protein YceH (UPF0502 family)
MDSRTRTLRIGAEMASRTEYKTLRPQDYPLGISGSASACHQNTG